MIRYSMVGYGSEPARVRPGISMCSHYCRRPMRMRWASLSLHTGTVYCDQAVGGEVHRSIPDQCPVINLTTGQVLRESVAGFL